MFDVKLSEDQIDLIKEALLSYSNNSKYRSKLLREIDPNLSKELSTKVEDIDNILCRVFNLRCSLS